MESRGKRFPRQRQVLLLFVFLGGSLAGSESRRYYVDEEKEKGFLIANLLKDLGLKVGELTERGAQVVSKGNKQYFQLNHETGDLILNEKLDREELCGPTEPCILHFQIILQDPLQFVKNELQVMDVNDHPPVFFENEMQLKILESTPPGTIIPLGNAEDVDVGRNSLQNYTLAPNSYFHIVTRSRRDGRKYPELVLDKALDREQQPELSLTLTALDGGSPPRSGTAQINILVLDINDNAPEFEQTLYEVQILENSPINSVIVTVSASDLDAGTFGTVSYAFFHPSEEILKTFHLNPITGAMHLVKYLNFEEINSYEIDIEAKDGGGLSGKSTVIVQVVDVNDNPPELSFVTLHVLLVDGFSQPYLALPEAAPAQAQADSLTVYLVIALAAVSSLFLLCVLLFVAARLCRRASAASLGVCSVPEGPFPGHLLDVSGTGTLSHSYQYEVCLRGGTGTSDFKFLKPIIPSFLAEGVERVSEANPSVRNSFEFN
ncbi:Protocadherin beta-3 [Tupaia chinensis]|uniref:Protocadherin beta-3 n=1 Tax=Tupaia chinensis TaxID=246437 RepID=L9JUP7_TUPCH|nr:Protocadherin beta-3 [Tupaia chinensis]